MTAPLPTTRSTHTSTSEFEYGQARVNYSDIHGLSACDRNVAHLDNQHRLLSKVIGKYPPSIKDVLGSSPLSEVKRILDLGCGGGSWIIEVAHDFPKSSCVAIDLVPMQSAIMPTNCRSEVDDLNLGLEHFYGEFDFVHGRLISFGINDYARLIHHIAHVLRPNGLIELIESDFHVYDHSYQLLGASRQRVNNPWWSQWLAFTEMSAKKGGGSPNAANHLHRWVATHGAFEDIVYQDHWIPTNPYSEDEPWRKWGDEMKAAILDILFSGQSLLLGSAVPAPIVDELKSNAQRELLTASQTTFVRLRRIYARKRADYNVLS
ncbi:hypothetical protein ONZ45_g6852 [Pleurotus djamor]|nr:hypothetical protein ONZ45_g6852 [Pleurotus djamor]